MVLPELLAPAGSIQCAESAFDHGADAVYVGVGRFNLRAHSPGFTNEDFKALLEYSKDRGKRVYAALNIMPDDQLLEQISEQLLQLRNLDALPNSFIVSDPGVIAVCNRLVPEVKLHLSTQTGCFNSESLSFWKTQGIKRVVLPRELSLRDIKTLSHREILETEVFVHGAMCVSISGRCLLGAYVSRRHPNLGDCPQPCRYKYKIIPMEGPEPEKLSFIAEESKEGVYLLNSKDLCAIELIPQLVASGVSSLKIEGRNKSAHYVATVVKVYREALDRYKDEGENFKTDTQWITALKSIEHRTYTTGFYEQNQMKQEVFNSKAQAGYRLIATVKEIHEGVAVADVKNSFDCGSNVNILPVQHKLAPYEVKIENLTDLNGNTITRAPTNRLVKISITGTRLRPGDMLRIKL
ncbi:U32 family peptidase C-terminal domain-containing protein [Chitinispirillales bacterium ANBcel5]|uniref:U32 family peptidase C-terminal domain-containing protein n=1 Tax=Cellulosispirillum alkaliphilum TaxID=3039283 RepID=UPI002A57F37C|nr:U32 family peptidase C-terminal domain-containing protein [Chitinispirillales bacterium ANBcel5]